jgi:hypothetical protein
VVTVSVGGETVVVVVAVLVDVTVVGVTGEMLLE